MSTSFSEEALLEAIRNSPPGTRARLLRELLQDHLAPGGSPDKVPPPLSPEQEVEMQRRLSTLDDSVESEQFIKLLDQEDARLSK
jgi:hypothetical protein